MQGQVSISSRVAVSRGALVLAVVGLVSCDPAADNAAPAGGEGGACPPCDCASENDDDTDDTGSGDETGDEVVAPVSATGGVVSPHPEVAEGDLADLAASANRKMMHGDGKGCLADMQRMRALDPKLESRMAVLRGQCEMLVGRCQEGKARISAWYVREQAMTKPFADKTAESIGSMRCRGGNSTDRDRLLVALQDLSDGAYMNKRSVDYCQTRIDLVKVLGPKVKPRGPEDTQVTGGQQALFHTGAMCLARAGDCQAAYRTYQDLFPGHGLDQIKDPAMRKQVIKDAFDSGVVLCEGKVP